MYVMSIPRDCTKIYPSWKKDTKRDGSQQCFPTTAGNYRETPATYKRKVNVK
jgi:hypothetical protein